MRFLRHWEWTDLSVGRIIDKPQRCDVERVRRHSSLEKDGTLDDVARRLLLFLDHAFVDKPL